MGRTHRQHLLASPYVLIARLLLLLLCPLSSLSFSLLSYRAPTSALPFPTEQSYRLGVCSSSSFSFSSLSFSFSSLVLPSPPRLPRCSPSYRPNDVSTLSLPIARVPPSPCPSPPSLSRPRPLFLSAFLSRSLSLSFTPPSPSAHVRWTCLRPVRHRGELVEREALGVARVVRHSPQNATISRRGKNRTEERALAQRSREGAAPSGRGVREKNTQAQRGAVGGSNAGWGAACTQAKTAARNEGAGYDFVM